MRTITRHTIPFFIAKPPAQILEKKVALRVNI
jgi:hypothetical protein